MSDNLKKTPIWADLKAFANTLDESQLSEPVRWWGEERGGRILSAGALEEDYMSDGEGYSPKSSYDLATLAYMEETGSIENIMPKGTPMIYVD